MTQHILMITPTTKVGELLEAYPALEEVLIEISPVFAKLKNPVLRKTVARVATLQQAAVIGNMPVEELVNRLRLEAGLDLASVMDEYSSWLSELPPEWFDPEKISDHFDAIRMINAGDSPMNEILQRAKKLEEGNILELVTPFVPAPILEILIEKGYPVWVKKIDTGAYSFIMKPQKNSE
jgi:hypothetical protein